MHNISLAPLSPRVVSDTRITCCKCNRSVMYSEAVMLAWSYDRNGEAFRAYYCGACAQRVMQENNNV